MKMKDRTALAKRMGSKRWTPARLKFSYLTWKLFAKKGVEFNLPGPTSTSHPWGFVRIPENILSYSDEEIKIAFEKVVASVQKTP